MLSSEIIELLKEAISIGGFVMFLDLINSNFIPPWFDVNSEDTLGLSLMDLATTTANTALINYLKGILELF